MKAPPDSLDTALFRALALGLHVESTIELKLPAVHLPQGGQTVLVGGDMNAPPDSLDATLFRALLPGLRDSWGELHLEEPGHTSNSPDNTLAAGSGAALLLVRVCSSIQLHFYSDGPAGCLGRAAPGGAGPHVHFPRQHSGCRRRCRHCATIPALLPFPKPSAPSTTRSPAPAQDREVGAVIVHARQLAENLLC